MRKYKGEIALLFVALTWGTGFVATAVALQQFGTFQVLAIRFILSALILGTVFFKKILTIDKTNFKYGITLGMILIGGYIFQTTGLLYTTPANNAFIVATCVVIVPFIGTIIYRRKLDANNILGAFTAMAGIIVMSFTIDAGFNFGDAITLVGTVFFAFHLFYTSEFRSRGSDTACIVTIQIATCGIVAAIGALVSGQTDFSRAAPSGIAILLFMAVFTTSICFFTQTWAQKYVSETKAVIIISSECIFGAALSIFLRFESFSIRMFFGAVMILCGMLITEIRPMARKKKAEQ